MPTGLTASRASENVLGRHDQGLFHPDFALCQSVVITCTTLLPAEHIVHVITKCSASGVIIKRTKLKRQFDAGEGLNGLDVKEAGAALAMVDSLKPIAASLGCSLPQLAIAWCLKNPNVSTVILGASKASQVTENLAALSVVPKLTSEKLAELDEVLKNKPKPNKEWGGRGAGRNFP